MNRRHNFEYRVSFHALFEQNFTDAHESQQTGSLNSVHINLGQKKLTALVCKNNKNLRTDFSKKCETIITQ